MVQYCIVPLCSNNAKTPGISFFSLPSDKNLRKTWLIKIRRDEKKSATVSDTMRVCSEHFSEADLEWSRNGRRRRLKKGTIPSVFKFSSASTQNKKRRFIEKYKPENDETFEEENIVASCSSVPLSPEHEIISEDPDILVDLDCCREKVKKLEKELNGAMIMSAQLKLTIKKKEDATSVEDATPMSEDALGESSQSRQFLCDSPAILMSENESLKREVSQLKDYATSLVCRLKPGAIPSLCLPYIKSEIPVKEQKEADMESKEWNILVGCTGSVASVKAPLISKWQGQEILGRTCKLKFIATNNSRHFFSQEDIVKDCPVLTDKDEWDSRERQSDSAMHIEMQKWADIFIIAPLDANTLAKIINGLCDNLLTSVVRAWDHKKPLLFCPAMNTLMFMNPVTAKHLSLLESFGYIHVPSVVKKLACGDFGVGGMAAVDTIHDYTTKALEKYLRAMDATGLQSSNSGIGKSKNNGEDSTLQKKEGNAKDCMDWESDKNATTTDKIKESLGCSSNESDEWHVLIGCSDNQAAAAGADLLNLNKCEIAGRTCKVRFILTEKALNFFPKDRVVESCEVFSDEDEWNSWTKMGDPVLHIELRKWADIFVIAPLDANTLAKIASGICDNLLTCVVRAWDYNKPLLFCPVMNRFMFQNPFTFKHVSLLEVFGYVHVPNVTLDSSEKKDMLPLDSITDYISDALVKYSVKVKGKK